MSNVPDLTASVGAPRVAAIEHPFSLTMGRPCDPSGQMAVLRAVLDALVHIDTPGTVEHLPFRWPEDSDLEPHPDDSPPIAKYLVRHPWHVRSLLKRRIP